MSEFYFYSSNKSDIAYKAMLNWTKANSNPIAIAHAIEQCEKVAVAVSDSSTEYITFSSSYDEINYLLANDFIVSIYGIETYFFNSAGNGGDFDLAILRYDSKDHTLYATCLKASKNISVVDRVTIPFVMADFIQRFIKTQKEKFRYYPETEVGFLGIRKDGFMTPVAVEEGLDWVLEDVIKEEEGSLFNKAPEISKSENINETKGNKIMKVNNIVIANKSAAVSVAKIEAGRIAVKQAVKMIKPAVPVMARGYLETALGELIVANLFKFAVDNFAANNDKAALVADAMLQGAMLGTIQSLNVEQLINEVLGKVDLSKFTESSD